MIRIVKNIQYPKEYLNKKLNEEIEKLSMLNGANPIFRRDIDKNAVEILVCKMNIHRFKFIIENYGEQFTIQAPTIRKVDNNFTIEYKIGVHKKDENEQ